MIATPSSRGRSEWFGGRVERRTRYGAGRGGREARAGKRAKAAHSVIKEGACFASKRIEIDSHRAHLVRPAAYGMVWYGMVWYGMVWYGMV